MFKMFEAAKNCKAEEKCGEVFRCEDNIFTIICTGCHMKHFDYQKFLDHFKIIHVNELKEPAKDELNFCADYFAELGTSAMEIKEEILDENICLPTSKNKATSAETNISRTSTNQKKAKHVEPSAAAFESITLNSPINSDQVADYALSGDEDMLQTNTDLSCELKKENKKCTKNDKLTLKLHKAYNCDRCEKKFVSAAGLKQHQRFEHLSQKNTIFKCNQCIKVFSCERSLTKHVNITHKKHKCSQCERTYKNRGSLVEHNQTYHETSNFICDREKCGKSFKSALKLRRHQRLHINNLNHVCEICGYRTRDKNVLVVHLRTHTGEKPYPCKVCGKRFISQSMVAEHQATHSTDRQHKCEVCGATFSSPKALYHHKHLHLGIKKFICRICDKAYAQAAGLSAHMRQHKVYGKIM